MTETDAQVRQNERAADFEFQARCKALDVAVSTTASARAQGQSVTLTDVAQEAYDFIVAGILGPQKPTHSDPETEALFDV